MKLVEIYLSVVLVLCTLGAQPGHATGGVMTGFGTLSCKIFLNLNPHPKQNTNTGHDCNGVATGTAASLSGNSCTASGGASWVLNKPGNKGRVNFWLDNIQYEVLNATPVTVFANGKFHITGTDKQKNDAGCEIVGTFDVVAIEPNGEVTLPAKKAVKGQGEAVQIQEATKAVKCPATKNPQGSMVWTVVRKGLPSAGKTEVWISGKWSILC